MRKLQDNFWWSSKVIRIYAVFVALFIFFLGTTSLIVAADSPHPTPAHGQRIVTIFDNGDKQTVLTKSSSLKDVLDKAGVAIDKNDVVEPEIDTELVSSNYNVNIYRAHPVLVVDGPRREKVLSSHQTPRDIARDAGLTLQDEDELTLTLADPVTEGVGSKLTIKRAYEVTLVLYGKKSKVFTQAVTVGDFLKEKDITLKKNDTLSVDENTPIKSGVMVEIWRNGVQTVTKKESVDYGVRQIQDADKKVGYRKVKTPGVKGEQEVTYEVTMKNGKEVKRKKIQSVIIKQPKEEVVIVGAKSNFDGDFADALAKLRSCEGGYNSWNPAGPYYGAYQFDRRTWNSVSNAPYGSASPAEQDAAARALYERRGWQPWPHCGASLPDTFR